VSQWSAEFITGEKSISGDWSHYLSGLKALGLDNYMKISQQVMGKPVNTKNTPYMTTRVQSEKALLNVGPLPALDKKYLEESGVPASYFESKS
jgi:hypothetical protein